MELEQRTTVRPIEPRMSDVGGVLGLESGTVRLVEYNPRWPGLFSAEARRILDGCRGLPLTLEHVGGTSIHGMCAKPVLDIVAGRPAGSATEGYIAALEQAGEQGWIAVSPFPRKVLPKVPERDPARLSDEEVAKLVVMPEPWGFVARFAIGTGLRW